MIVCSHGNVKEFCEANDMLIVEDYDGEIENYRGLFRVLVTDQKMSENEYYTLKGQMLRNGYELVSVDHRDRHCTIGLVIHMASQRREKFGGRHMFGVGDDGLTNQGRLVVKRIFEMRDAGFTYRQIQADENVCHPDGRNLSISTIQTIVKNREKYIKRGL